jgi:hypothetical protein
LEQQTRVERKTTENWGSAVISTRREKVTEQRKEYNKNRKKKGITRNSFIYERDYML